MRSAANLRRMLEGSAIRESHRECGRVQDAYSLRCMPQVHGAVRDALNYCAQVLEIEMNSAVDNPLVFVAPKQVGARQSAEPHGDIISGGNFHGEPVAFALDFLAIALSALAGISERRIERLVNPSLNEGLPPFLANAAGLNSGFMMAQVTAAALVSENKVLAHPASVDSITTSGNKEDYVSMGMTGAIKLKKILANALHVLAIEAIAAAQALGLSGAPQAGQARAAGHGCDSCRLPAPGARSQPRCGFRAGRRSPQARGPGGGAAVDIEQEMTRRSHSISALCSCPRNPWRSRGYKLTAAGVAFPLATWCTVEVSTS